jgi:hypothetical protein
VSLCSDGDRSLAEKWAYVSVEDNLRTIAGKSFKDIPNFPQLDTDEIIVRPQEVNPHREKREYKKLKRKMNRDQRYVLKELTRAIN